jgi:hypothetical protein
METKNTTTDLYRQRDIAMAALSELPLHPPTSERDELSRNIAKLQQIIDERESAYPTSPIIRLRGIVVLSENELQRVLDATTLTDADFRSMFWMLWGRFSMDADKWAAFEETVLYHLELREEIEAKCELLRKLNLPSPISTTCPTTQAGK